MDKKEIKDYLKRVDDLETRLTGEDKENLAWLIYGYNQCAKMLNETEQQCKKQKEVIDKVVECLNLWQIPECDKGTMREILFNTNKQNLLDILKEGKNE